MLGIDDRGAGFDDATGALAPGRVHVGVVEGVERITRSDLEEEASAGVRVVDEELEAVILGVPERRISSVLLRRWASSRPAQM